MAAMSPERTATVPRQKKRLDGVESVIESVNDTTLVDPINDREICTGDWLSYDVVDDGNGYYDHIVLFNDVPSEYVNDVFSAFVCPLGERGYTICHVDFEDQSVSIIDRWWYDRLSGDTNE